MATRIITKNGSGAPLASDLQQGELAVDLTNKRLYTEDSLGAVQEIGTNPTSLTTGTLTATSLDVTGTVTADELTVDGESAVITLNNTDVSLSLGQTLGRIDFDQNDPSDQGVGTVASIEVENRGSIQGLGQFNFKTGSATANLDRLSIAENGDISFYEDTGTTAKFFWDASAESLGIGTSSPATPLQVRTGTNENLAVQTKSGAIGITAFNDAVSSNVNLHLQGTQLIFDGAGSAERMRIDSSGNLLVGTTNTTPSASNVDGFSVAASGFISLTGSGTSAIDCNRTNDGTVQVFRRGGVFVGSVSVSATATAYNTSSDQRLKENITDADDAGSKIDAIQVRQYDWKADGSHQDYGMIAQELMTAAPEAVSGDPESDQMMGVDYSKLVPMLIKEVQSLRARVAQLETGV